MTTTRCSGPTRSSTPTSCRDAGRRARGRAGDVQPEEIVTSHAAFSYLAERYGLTQLADRRPVARGRARRRPPRRAGRPDRARRASPPSSTRSWCRPTWPRRWPARPASRRRCSSPIEGLSEDELDDGKDYVAVMRDNLAALRKAARLPREPTGTPSSAPTGVSVRATARTPRCSTACPLAVGAGEFVALVGPNGSGKSTLLPRPARRCCAPDAGTVRLFGAPPGALARPLAARLRAPAPAGRRPAAGHRRRGRRRRAAGPARLVAPADRRRPRRPSTTPSTPSALGDLRRPPAGRAVGRPAAAGLHRQGARRRARAARARRADRRRRRRVAAPVPRRAGRHPRPGRHRAARLATSSARSPTTSTACSCCAAARSTSTARPPSWPRPACQPRRARRRPAALARGPRMTVWRAAAAVAVRPRVHAARPGRRRSSSAPARR